MRGRGIKISLGGTSAYRRKIGAISNACPTVRSTAKQTAKPQMTQRQKERQGKRQTMRHKRGTKTIRKTIKKKKGAPARELKGVASKTAQK